ncbi:Retrovirus-related Pol polyprotein from transposon opus [Thelohanellus kitauei]|uniref:Retrovirus-related Pol polyprotein from transposon opus n=1 Tax=Thelohanellus kitauei TaxID=669202 RepID=A0A0C2J891_THEKT|nr:Retrovirus-related Pol polyprotein from transposon opus [Thelohanellus kitauei]
MDAILGNDFLSTTNAVIIPTDGRLTFDNLRHPSMNFSDTDLKVRDSEKLNKLLRNFDAVFAQHEWDLGRYSAAFFDIHTNEHRPVVSRCYPIPQSFEKEVESQLTEMLKLKIIRQSKSPYRSSILLIDKKDKSKRLCVDYRSLNLTVEDDKYPLPIIENTLQRIASSAFFF